MMLMTTTTTLTDKKAFNVVFKELRKEGFVARQNYWCCQSCAWSALDSDYEGLTDDSDIVFYHGQDAEAFDGQHLKERGIYLAWSGNGNKIKEVFERHGFKVEWDGGEHTRIRILPRESAQS